MSIPLVITKRYEGQGVTSPLLKPTGIQIATKSFPGPTTRERKLIGVKTIGTFEYEVQFPLFDVLPVCVRCHPIYSEGQTFCLLYTFRYIMWTHQPGSHWRNATQEFSLPFFYFFLRCSLQRSLVDREVEFCVPTTYCDRSPLVGHDVRDNSSSCGCVKIRTHVPSSEGFEVNN